MPSRLLLRLRHAPLLSLTRCRPPFCPQDSVYEGGVRIPAFLVGGALPKTAPKKIMEPTHIADWRASRRRPALAPR